MSTSLLSITKRAVAVTNTYYELGAQNIYKTATVKSTFSDNNILLDITEQGKTEIPMEKIPVQLRVL